MIDEIDWTSIQNENDVTLRLPYMDLSNAYFVDAYLYGANFYARISLMPTLAMPT